MLGGLLVLWSGRFDRRCGRCRRLCPPYHPCTCPMGHLVPLVRKRPPPRRSLVGRHIIGRYGVGLAARVFCLCKRQNARRRHSSPRPKPSENTAFFRETTGRMVRDAQRFKREMLYVRRFHADFGGTRRRGACGLALGSGRVSRCCFASRKVGRRAWRESLFPR